MQSVVERNIVMRRLTVYAHTHTHTHTYTISLSLSLSLSLTHTHTHTHTHTQSYAGTLVFQFIYPPNNSEYLERLADKVYHAHMRQCCQYSTVLSLCRVVRSRVEALSSGMWFTFLFWGAGLHIRFAADIVTRTVDTCTTTCTPNVRVAHFKTHNYICGLVILLSWQDKNDVIKQTKEQGL